MLDLGPRYSGETVRRDPPAHGWIWIDGEVTWDPTRPSQCWWKLMVRVFGIKMAYMGSQLSLRRHGSIPVPAVYQVPDRSGTSMLCSHFASQVDRMIQNRARTMAEQTMHFAVLHLHHLNQFAECQWIDWDDQKPRENFVPDLYMRPDATLEQKASIMALTTPSTCSSQLAGELDPYDPIGEFILRLLGRSSTSWLFLPTLIIIY